SPGFASLTGLAMVAFPLTRVLLGPEWDTAGQIIPFLCVAGAAMALTATQEAYLLALDRVDGYLGVIAIEAVLGVILIGFASSFGAVAPPRARAGGDTRPGVRPCARLARHRGRGDGSRRGALAPVRARADWRYHLSRARRPERHGHGADRCGRFHAGHLRAAEELRSG